MTTTAGQLTQLTAGTLVPFGGDRFTTVDETLAAAFRPGDRLYVVHDDGALLHVPAAVSDAVTTSVSAAVEAAQAMRSVPAVQVAAFYRAFADGLVTAWDAIAAANSDDVMRAEGLGRSTTRLRIDAAVRDQMAEGLRGWADLVEKAASDDVAPPRVTHADWHVDVVTAPLGVIGFVFEGRPNVLADAAGVLATGNTAVLRIGGDALGTGTAIVEHALAPALRSSGLPDGAISLVTSRERSAGWALFADRRLSLGVVRGSGAAVAQLAAVARQAGTPVSAHGTGGAWLVADESAQTARFASVVRHSLDRKVCNTLNVAAIPRSRAAELVPVLLAAADEAAAARGTVARVHVVAGSEQWLPAGELERTIDVHRAEGVVAEPRASLLAADELGREWEWENTPELSLVVVEDVAEAVALFNAYSPRFVASLVGTDAEAWRAFVDAVDAPFVGDGFTRWVDGQYALDQPELGLSNWEHGRLLGRAGVLTGADLTTRRLVARTATDQHR
ncbi:aldehyde dehydrogenase family protein [Cellulomonas persica]|uniref:Gamma-glutamyl phosphate reductase n=1 Tax=Cellulomonas persica TaxID=76861 RepID=A0A510US50_9CELL|nr:aldehyde dehydrogenase family protein [Cellulomonas persica]GEK17487.1 gamma-glutamyl phosphate reductase [Cellulomonas persica]